MAVLQQPVTHSNPFSQQIGDALAPAGTYIATILDIHDEFGVSRQKFQSQEIEKVDLTCFLFGFRDAQGQPNKVASRQMKISANEKSALFGFLKSLMGRAPSIGWDYCALKGAKCLLTVEHVQRRDGSGVFASIAALSPLPAGYDQPAQVAPQPMPTVQPVAQPPVHPTTPQAAYPAPQAPTPVTQAPAPQPSPQIPPAAPLPPAPAAPAVAPSVTTNDDDVPF
jgi:hypothetical protein